MLKTAENSKRIRNTENVVEHQLMLTLYTHHSKRIIIILTADCLNFI